MPGCAGAGVVYNVTLFVSFSAYRRVVYKVNLIYKVKVMTALYGLQLLNRTCGQANVFLYQHSQETANNENNNGN